MDELRVARWSLAGAFGIHAVVFGTWAPRVPALKAELGLDEGELGIALTGLAVGLFVGTRVASRPIERFGSAAVVRATTPFVCLALVGPALAGGLGSLTGALAALGIVGGLADVAMNAAGVTVERGLGRPIMSGLHGVWSVGLLVGGAGASGAAAAGADLRSFSSGSSRSCSASSASSASVDLTGLMRAPRARGRCGSPRSCRCCLPGRCSV